MKGDTIPDQNHVARYCKSTQAPDGQIQATAFMLRADEETLSVNWLELLNCSSRESEIVEIRKIYSNKFNRVGAGAKTAILSVGEIRKKVLEESPDGRNIEVVHGPLENDQSHSEIRNLKPDNELIAELILETVHESYSARIQK